MIRILTNLEKGLNYTLTPAGSDYTREEGSEPAELKRLQLIERLLCAEMRDVPSDGHLERYQPSNTNTADLHLSLRALGGSGHGQIADKRRRVGEG